MIAVMHPNATPQDIDHVVDVVAFREESGNDGTPLWDRLTLVRRGVHDLTVPGAHFAYVVLSIDYAK